MKLSAGDCEESPIKSQKVGSDVKERASLVSSESSCQFDALELWSSCVGWMPKKIRMRPDID